MKKPSAPGGSVLLLAAAVLLTSGCPAPSGYQGSSDAGVVSAPALGVDDDPAAASCEVAPFDQSEFVTSVDIPQPGGGSGAEDDYDVDMSDIAGYLDPEDTAIDSTDPLAAYSDPWVTVIDDPYFDEVVLYEDMFASTLGGSAVSATGDLQVIDPMGRVTRVDASNLTTTLTGLGIGATGAGKATDVITSEGTKSKTYKGAENDQAGIWEMQKYDAELSNAEVVLTIDKLDQATVKKVVPNALAQLDKNTTKDRKFLILVSKDTTTKGMFTRRNAGYVELATLKFERPDDNIIVVVSDGVVTVKPVTPLVPANVDRNAFVDSFLKWGNYFDSAAHRADYFTGMVQLKQAVYDFNKANLSNFESNANKLMNPNDLTLDMMDSWLRNQVGQYSDDPSRFSARGRAELVFTIASVIKAQGGNGTLWSFNSRRIKPKQWQDWLTQSDQLRQVASPDGTVYLLSRRQLAALMDPIRNKQLADEMKNPDNVSVQLYDYIRGALIQTSDGKEWYIEGNDSNFGTPVKDADRTNVVATQKLPAPNASTVVLHGFRGMRTLFGSDGTARAVKFVIPTVGQTVGTLTLTPPLPAPMRGMPDPTAALATVLTKTPLLWTGHVGVEASYRTIAGYTPQFPDTCGGNPFTLDDGMRALREYKAFPGILKDDTASFRDAQKRYASEGWNTQVWPAAIWVSSANKAGYAKTITTMIAAKAGAGNKYYYQFPRGKAPFFPDTEDIDGKPVAGSKTANCATFPKFIGLAAVPDNSGLMAVYMKTLEDWWTNAPYGLPSSKESRFSFTKASDNNPNLTYFKLETSVDVGQFPNLKSDNAAVAKQDVDAIVAKLLESGTVPGVELHNHIMGVISKESYYKITGQKAWPLLTAAYNFYKAAPADTRLNKVPNIWRILDINWPELNTFRAKDTDTFDGKAQVIFDEVLNATNDNPFTEPYEIRDDLLDLTKTGYDKVTTEVGATLFADSIRYSEQSASVKKASKRFTPEVLGTVKNVDIRLLPMVNTMMMNKPVVADDPFRVDESKPQQVLPQDEQEALAKVLQERHIMGIDIAGPERRLLTNQALFNALYKMVSLAARFRGRPMVFRPHVGEGFMKTADEYTPFVQGETKYPNYFNVWGSERQEGVPSHYIWANKNVGTLLGWLSELQNTDDWAPHWVMVRFGHATHTDASQAQLMQKLDVWAEANLIGNVVTGAEQPATAPDKLPAAPGRVADAMPVDFLDQHALMLFLYYKVKTVLGTDSQGVNHTTLPAVYDAAKALIDRFKAGKFAIKLADGSTRTWSQLNEDEQSRFDIKVLQGWAQQYWEWVRQNDTVDSGRK